MSVTVAPDSEAHRHIGAVPPRYRTFALIAHLRDAHGMTEVASERAAIATPCSHGTRWRWRYPSLHIGMHAGARALGDDGRRLARRVQTRCHVPTRNDSTVRSVRGIAVSEQSVRATLSPGLGSPDPLPTSRHYGRSSRLRCTANYDPSYSRSCEPDVDGSERGCC